MSELKRIKYFGAHPSGMQIGGASDLLGFYGTTPCDQPASANQAAVAVSTITTASTSTTPYGYATSTQATNVAATVESLVTLVNQMRTDLVELGLLKGSA